LQVNTIADCALTRQLIAGAMGVDCGLNLLIESASFVCYNELGGLLPMRKQKIYLDTSVISYLDQADAPDKMNDTLALWEEIRRGLYEVYISEVGMNELSENSESKLHTLLGHLSDIDYVLIHLTDEIRAHADKIVEVGILSNRHYDDCLHIACAVINECHMLLSWNFKHVVRVKTISGVNMINAMLGYKEIGIFPPNMLVEWS